MKIGVHHGKEFNDYALIPILEKRWAEKKAWKSAGLFFLKSEREETSRKYEEHE